VSAEEPVHAKRSAVTDSRYSLRNSVLAVAAVNPASRAGTSWNLPEIQNRFLLL
jgi:hypothetical protein